jgi:hypothetical protein
VGAGKLLVAGHFDEPAAALQESSFGVVDQGSSDPASSHVPGEAAHDTCVIRHDWSLASLARNRQPCDDIFGRRVEAQLLHRSAIAAVSCSTASRAI